MSDASFDTSAADTLTSGLSLGQFIKNVAEECQPPERWYELQPTVEKEWHTLQGEPPSRETGIEGATTQNPLGDVSTFSSKQSSSNPVTSLIKHSEKQKHFDLPQIQDKSGPHHLASLDLGTPSKVTHKQPLFLKNSNADKLPHDYFVTPAISYQTKPQVDNYSFTKTPLSTQQQLLNYSRNNDQLSAQDISSLLEKDDSLAQRVKDLLEDNASIRSEASDLAFPKNLARNIHSIPTLLRQKSDTEQSEKQQSNSTTGSEHASEPCQDEHIVLSDASVCSANDKAHGAKATNRPNDMLTTLNLFSDSGFNVTNLTEYSIGAGDALESLNASRGTEYGELPETVDIPKDIVSRLNNMRLISQQQKNQSNEKIAEHTTQFRGLIPETLCASHVHPPPTSTSSELNTNPSVQPISGDVKFYTGSNPTTPQFPIEEEKLKQLQSYIEKKTGLPTISPLVVGAQPSANMLLLPEHKDGENLVPTAVYGQGSNITPLSLALPSVTGSTGTSSLLSTTPLNRQDMIKSSANRQRDDSAPSSGGKANPLHFDSSQRCDPEGMSPPINSNAVPLVSVKNGIVNGKTPSNPVLNQSNVQIPHTNEEAEDDSYLSENLTDESLLARIKSALSDSFAQRSVSGQLDKSDVSLSSSIDSLAVHVKALLKEEVPKLLPAEDQETSNLSEVIENFEQTDLWKFVAQFMPSVAGQFEKSFQQGNVDDLSLAGTVKGDDTMTESTLENSILDRIRAELRKSSFNTDSDVTSSPPKVAIESSPEVKEIRRLENSRSPQNSEIAKQSSMNKPSSAKTIESSNLHAIDEEPSNIDPIPGIPDFSPSVLQHSSPSGPFLGNRFTNSQKDQHVKSAWPENNFSNYKRSARNVITSQLSRAAQRNFDVSLTPARLQAPVKKPAAKDEDHTSPRKSVDTSSLQARSAPSSARSAYFDKPDASTTTFTSKQGNRSQDIDVRSSRISPSDAGKSSRSEWNQGTTSSNKSISCQTVDSEASPVIDVAKHKNISVTPMMSCGVPSASKHVSLVEPHRSEPSSYFPRYGSVEGTRSSSSSERFSQYQSRSYGGSPRKSTSPLRNRVTVHDWLKSPERKRTMEKQKYLPTFDELMEEDRKKAKALREDLGVNGARYLLERDRNLQSPNLLLQSRHSSREPQSASSFKASPRALFVEKSIKKSDFDKSSLRPQMDANDSYQQVSFNTPGLPTTTSRSSLQSTDESDVNIQRRVINQPTSDSEAGTKFGQKMPRSVTEFESMDEKAQRKFLRHILDWVNHKKRSSTSGLPPKPPSTSSSYSGSLSSNQAVYDSDSTEYCDLPSTRPATGFDTSTPSLISMDEAKAEKIMKKLMEKIRRQKEQERHERKKAPHKRGAATSSTPQKRRPPLPVPEASSIASTDTDAGGEYVIKVRDVRRHPTHKKVAYIEEVSESEPTTYVRLKRKTKKSEPAPARVILRDRLSNMLIRSVQTVSSQESVTAQTSILKEKSPKKQEKKSSKGIQNYGETDENDKENQARGKRRNGPQQRMSSFFVDFKNGKATMQTRVSEKRRVYDRGVAWYEPFRYEPCWMTQADKDREDEARGLVRLTLQEALADQHPAFISRSRERQRRITIHSDERRLQEIWEEERQRLFGARNEAKPSRRSEPPPRRNLLLTRKQIVAETREKYEQLPEMVKKREEERRKREYASNRIKSQLYKKKIQNRVLGRFFA